MKMHPAVTPSAIAVLDAATLGAVCAADPSARVTMLEDLLRQPQKSSVTRELQTLLFRARAEAAKVKAAEAAKPAPKPATQRKAGAR